MSDLISRQDAIDAFEEQLDYLQMLNKNENPKAESKWYGINWARNTIIDLPSVERKKGEWILDKKRYQCSICGQGAFSADFVYGARFCPICGADMRNEV